jgi:exosortase/archaeosortase family protein
MTVAQPTSPRTRLHPQSPPRRIHPFDRAARILVGLALVTATVLLVVGQETFRYAEAVVMTAILKPFLGERVFSLADQFVVRLDETHYLGLQITVECTTLVLVVPTLAFCAIAIMCLRNLRWTGWIIGALVGLAMVSVVNLARIGMIAAATVWWKDGGYEWSHLLIGTVFALIGIVASLAVMLRIMTGPRRSRRRSTAS